MEKINVAEILKDCPKGMELDCVMYDNLYFESLNSDYYGTINCYTLIDGIKTSINFTKYGTFNNHTGAKCVIFPKGKTTWGGFHRPFKDGDIVSTMHGVWIGIVKKSVNSSYETYITINGESLVYDNPIFCFEKFATEEEKQKLFQVIKENGYRWNAETKVLEELPKFRVDDKIKLKGGDEFGIITEVADCFYTIKCKNNTHCWPIKKQDDWELVSNQLVKPQFKVGDRIRRKNGNEEYIIISINDCTYYYRLNGHCTGSLGIQLQDEYELVPNKFDITTLKPFESRVLVRTKHFHDKWIAGFFSHKDSDGFAPFWTTADKNYQQCIPYEGNEHLLGKTDDCDEHFKTWK